MSSLVPSSPRAWLTESRVRVQANAPDDAVLDAIEAMLNRRRGGVTARSADTIEFTGPGLLGEGFVMMTVYQQLRTYVRRGTISLGRDGAGRVLTVRVEIGRLHLLFVAIAAIFGVVANPDAATRMLVLCGVVAYLVFVHVGCAHSYDYLIADALRRAGQGSAPPSARARP